MKILAVQNKDDSVRQASSSGGVFYALAKWIILQGGAVVGAAYGETAREVKHMVVEHVHDLHRLQKSKYAPSSLSNPNVDAVLRSATHRYVLFSGTPCQVLAIRKRYGYLPKLFLLEVACHGVPRKKEYLRYLDNNNIVGIDFRCKKKGWQNSEIEIKYADGRVAYQKSSDNPFYQDYISGRNLRKACFSCTAKYFRSGADFTLADFWGVESFVPNMNDNKGTSVVFLHTKKARRMWAYVDDELVCNPISFYEATCWNPCVYRPFGSAKTFREKCENRKFVLKSYWKRIKEKLKR